MHYTFILPVLHDSHFEKRIDNLKKTGINLQVLGFERNHYPAGDKDKNITSLGFVEHGKYLKRFPTFLKSLFTVRKKIKNTDIIYCFNIETLLIAWIASLSRPKKYKLVYDVADIREILIENKLVSSLLRFIERFLIKRTHTVVVTAPAYIDGYFHGFLKLFDTQFHVIENKVDSESFEFKNDISNSIDDTSKTIKIGYFGVIRCNHSLRLLKDLLEKSNGKFKLYIRGIFQDHLNLMKEDLLELDNVHYGGPFVSPDDLFKIYNDVDLSWTAIYHFKPNVMWSRTNRFYQACYFKRPMITQEGTPDAEQVKNLEIGLSIDLTNPSSSLQKLHEIKPSDVMKWKENINKVPKSVYILNDEHEVLAKNLVD